MYVAIFRNSDLVCPKVPFAIFKQKYVANGNWRRDIPLIVVDDNTGKIVYESPIKDFELTVRSQGDLDLIPEYQFKD